MKFFMQLLITGIIFWVSSKIFPNYVAISDTKTLVIAAIAYTVLSAFLAFIIVGTLLALILDGQFVNAIILGCCLSLITSYVALTSTSAHIAGFEVVGFVPKLCIAFCTALFTSSSNHDNS